jgi:hypothetical protein
MTTYKCWLFVPGSKTIQVVNHKMELDDLYATCCAGSVKPTIECVTIPAPHLGKYAKFSIWMNENGIEEGGELNDTAIKVLSKLPIRWGWGGRLRGTYLVSFSSGLDEAEEDYVDADMPAITVKEFLTKGKQAMMGR